LEEGCKRLHAFSAEIEDLGITDRGQIWNTDLVEAFELQNLMIQAKMTMYAAENRKESRGAHARDDFSERDDENWCKHTMAFLDNPLDEPVITYRKVIQETLDDEMQTVPFAKRVVY